MPYISAVHSALPEHQVPSNLLEQIGKEWLAQNPEALERFDRIRRGSGVLNRNFTLPYHEILSLNGMEKRAAIFEQHGSSLLQQVLTQSLAGASTPPEAVGSFVFTSCSVPLIPSIDAKVILDSKLSPSIRRIPIYQHGCAGGVVALGLAGRLASLGSPVFVSAVELCSLVFQPNDHRGSQLVGAAIFADGAAGMLVDPVQGAIEIVASESFLIPDSRHLMGYDIFDDGFHLRLDRALPQALLKHAPVRLDSFLAQHNLTRSEIDYWLFHPGGIRILEYLEQSFAIEPERCRWSRDVLANYGNLSSATVLFVLKEFMQSRVLAKGQFVVMMGIGPGLTLELVLLRGSSSLD